MGRIRTLASVTGDDRRILGARRRALGASRAGLFAGAAGELVLADEGVPAHERARARAHPIEPTGLSPPNR
jgi:anti-sigma factor RsiW